MSYSIVFVLKKTPAQVAAPLELLLNNSGMENFLLEQVGKEVILTLYRDLESDMAELTKYLEPPCHENLARLLARNLQVHVDKLGQTAEDRAAAVLGNELIKAVNEKQYLVRDADEAAAPFPLPVNIDLYAIYTEPYGTEGLNRYYLVIPKSPDGTWNPGQGAWPICVLAESPEKAAAVVGPPPGFPQPEKIVVFVGTKPTKRVR